MRATALHRPIADCGCLNYGLTRQNCRPWATIYVSAKDVDLGKATGHEMGTPVPMCYHPMIRSGLPWLGQCAPQNNPRSIGWICQPSMCCSTTSTLSVLKQCLNRNLSQQCAGHAQIEDRRRDPPAPKESHFISKFVRRYERNHSSLTSYYLPKFSCCPVPYE